MKIRRLEIRFDVLPERRPVCARYISFQDLGPGMVPKELFPNNFEYLEKLFVKQVG